MAAGERPGRGAPARLATLAGADRRRPSSGAASGTGAEIEAEMWDGTDDRPEGTDALAATARLLIDEFSAVGAKLRGYAEVDEVLADLARASLRLVRHAEH